ncbi:MAG: hypothetical protein FWH48_00175, partial [Oscillospiraceae bacterium]|nr:hypothetical protein [Oscillospiraceae bacterium]
MYKFINLNIWLKLFLVLLVVFTYGLALIPIVLLFMALSSPKKAINEIINGLDTELQSFKLSWIGSMAGLGKLFTEALNCRPELMFVYNGYNINYRKGAFGGMSDIEILPEYETKYIGFDKSRVIKDEGSFDVMIELGKQKKQEDATGDVSSFELLIVSKNHGRIWQDLNANDERVYELLEGLVKYEADHFTRENCIYTAFIISFTYKRNAAQIRTMRISQENEAARLQDYLFGKKQLPPFIKIWLAFSYIQQNVEYDSAYVRAMMAGATMGTESETAFGALINKRATSRGIAEALALILEK